ncbi:amidase [Cryobacterium sp. Y57]|uniref:amidase n=1 Tax=Cryobacterium sp. Y57 TaxID=2048287 RepID=UPI000CE44B3A|nr:amidase [Cryobacterium sp. Y57]
MQSKSIFIKPEDATLAKGNPLHYAEISEVAELIARRSISVTDLLAAQLTRIEEFDPELKSFKFIDDSGARAAAAERDKELAEGFWRGPLHGVPLAVKDIYEIAGWPASMGMPSKIGDVSTVTATVVERLRSAGAIIVGKVHTTEGIYAEHTFPFEAPLNPWDRSKWTGVSSSGSGVASAAGLVFGALASDTGGSIRMPASANGVTGIKPTWGRVSRAGVFELAATLDHVGTLTRSVIDGAIMLSAIAGRDLLDPTASLLPVPDYAAVSPHGLHGVRIGIDIGWAYDDVSVEVSRALDSTLDVLTHLGARIVPVSFPDSRQIVEDWFDVCGVQTAVAHRNWYAANKGSYGPALAALIERGRKLSGTEYQELLLRRAHFRGSAQTVLNDIDALLIPGLPFPAPPAVDMVRMDEQTVTQVHRYTVPFTMSQLPTVTVPAGYSDDGLPVSVQFVGSDFDEATLIRLAAAFQAKTTWHKRHPTLTRD